MNPENNAYSEEYTKYLIEVRFKGNLYYTLSGADKTEEDKDVQLTDAVGHLLLFKEIPGLIQFIKEGENVFDPENSQLWVTHLKEPYFPYATIDFDMFLHWNGQFDRVGFSELINSWVMISNYAYQVEKAEMIDIFTTKEQRKLFDYYMDLYIWKEAEPKKYRYSLKKVKQMFATLHELLQNCVVIK